MHRHKLATYDEQCGCIHFLFMRSEHSSRSKYRMFEFDNVAVKVQHNIGTFCCLSKQSICNFIVNKQVVISMEYLKQFNNVVACENMVKHHDEICDALFKVWYVKLDKQ